MNSNNRKRQNKARTKAIVAIPMVVTILGAVILLSGLGMTSTYQQSVTAQQQNVTRGNVTTTAGGNATNVTTTAGGNATNVTAAGETTTLGGPTASQGEGAGGGTAGGGGATGSYGY
jgi:hypothetical protein